MGCVWKCSPTKFYGNFAARKMMFWNMWFWTSYLMDDDSKWQSSSLEFWPFGTSSLGYAIRLLTSSGDGWRMDCHVVACCWLISAANLISTMIRWFGDLYVWSRLTDCFPIGCQYSKCLKTELTSGKTVMLPKCRKSTENKHVDPKAELRYARTKYLAQRYARYGYSRSILSLVPSPSGFWTWSMHQCFRTLTQRYIIVQDTFQMAKIPRICSPKLCYVSWFVIPSPENKSTTSNLVNLYVK